MKVKKIIFLINLLSVTIGYAQTYSNIYNLSQDNKLIDNGRSTLRGMDIKDGNLFIHADHICDPDTTDNTRAFCTGVYKITLDGNLLTSMLFDSLFPLGNSRMVLTKDHLLITGHWHDSFDTSTTILKVLDLDLNEINTYAVGTQSQKSVFNNGLINDDQYVYLYGKTFDDQQEESHIQKINSNFQLVDEFRYSKGLPFNDCLDLQPTADGNLIYINRWSDGVGAQPSGAQIIVIDTDGNPLDSVNINQFTGLSRVLLSSSSGDVYCFSERNPNGQILQSHGRVNKYDKNLDSLLWSTELPFNNFTNARRYLALNMIEAQNGDILVCGTVFDEGPDGPIANGYDHTWNGFLTRLDTDGNILWLRLYKTDNNYPLVPKSEYGRFLNSTIWNIHELEDGRIVTGGTSYHTGWQNNIIRPAGETEFYVWLMTVNADGCLDDEECDEVIILDGENRPKDGYLPIITSDQTWISLGGGQTSPPKSSQYTYSEDSLLIDTNIYYERIQSNNEDGSEPWVQGYYRELEGKVYQKFEGNFNEEIIFDMSLIVGDTFPIYAENHLVVVNVDTVTYADNVARKRIELQCAENSEWFATMFWIEGIGELFSGTYCVIDGIDAHLRCVLDDGGQRVFSTIDIDQNCWLTTSLSELEQNTFSLFPNPAKEVINVETASDILRIDIFTPEGTLIRTVGESNSVDLAKIPTGIYYLKVTTNEGIGVKSFVKQ